MQVCAIVYKANRLSARISESCIYCIPHCSLLPDNEGLEVCLCASGLCLSSCCVSNEKSAAGSTVPKSVLLHVCLCCSSVPETTFDLHGDVHSGAALPTSKVTHVHTAVQFRLYFCPGQ